MNENVEKIVASISRLIGVAVGEMVGRDRVALHQTATMLRDRADELLEELAQIRPAA